MSTKTWVLGSPHVILWWFKGKVPKLYENFQMVITWIFWKLFELCKSKKYSSWSQLSNEYKNMGLRIIPRDPTVIFMVNHMAEVWSVGQDVIWRMVPEQKLLDMVQWAWGNPWLVHLDPSDDPRCDSRVILMENHVVKVWLVGQNGSGRVLPEQKLLDMVQWALGNPWLVH